MVQGREPEWNLPAPVEDGLEVMEVGHWSTHKHYFLKRYLHAFTTAMRGKQWSSLHYIDLFAGPGIVRLRDSAALEWGSPLIAAQIPDGFKRLHVCEQMETSYNALRVRLGRLRPESQVLLGNANDRIRDIVAQIPPKSLSVAFLDPYNLGLHFSTLQALSERRSDLIIFFPDHLDVLRNWKAYYKDQYESNLDRVLGPDVPWRSVLENTPPQNRIEQLRRMYEGQIRTLGYTQFEYERISMPSGPPLYRLIFCSRHEAGAKIWRGISRVSPDQQRSFDF